jgi:hypothetical protein
MNSMTEEVVVFAIARALPGREADLAAALLSAAAPTRRTARLHFV